MRPILPLLTLLLSSSLTAGAGGPSRELGLIKDGRGRGALRMVRPRLAQNPTDPHLNTIAGLAYATEGMYGHALAHLEWGNGTDLYPDAGLARHAESLRAVGRGAEGARLHQQRALQPDLSEGQRVTALLAALQDYRSAGLLQPAWDVAYETLSMRPKDPRVLAFAAELALDEGDVAQAQELIQAASMVPSPTPPLRLLIVQARLALAHGDPALAIDFLNQSSQPRFAIVDAVALRVCALMAQGQAAQALETLNKPNLVFREDPVLLAARTRVELALGREAQAQLTWTFLQSEAPGSPLFPEHVPGLSPEPTLQGISPK